MKKYKISCKEITSINDVIDAPAYLGISLLQQYNYTDQLHFTYLYLKERFPKIKFIIADDLLKYTFRALGNSEDAAESLKSESLNNWLAYTNKSAIDIHKDNSIFWNELKQDPGYTPTYKFVLDLYNQNEEFHKYIEITTAHSFKNYMTKYADNIIHNRFNVEEAVKFSREYLFEEMAVLLSFGVKIAKHSKAYVLYPKMKENSTFIGYILKCFEIANDEYDQSKLKFSLLEIEKYKSREKSKKNMIDYNHKAYENGIEANLHKIHQDMNNCSNQLMELIKHKQRNQ